LIPSPPCQWSPLRRRVLAPYPLQFINAPECPPSISQDSGRWFRPSFLWQLKAAPNPTRLPTPLLLSTGTHIPLTELDPFDDKPLSTRGYSITTSASSVAPTDTLNKIVPNGNVPSVISLPLDISPLPALLDLVVSPDTIPPSTAAVPPTLKSEVVPQMYNGGNVTEIPFVDESTERELLSLLGDWYEPKSIESLFLSMPSNAVFFSS